MREGRVFDCTYNRRSVGNRRRTVRREQKKNKNRVELMHIPRSTEREVTPTQQ